jgi:uncharacterized phiE125 gp8 family phage protein
MAADLEAEVFEEGTEEPLTLRECYDHLRLDPIDNVDSDGNGTRPDDDYIMSLVAAARSCVEEFTGVSITPKTYVLTLDSFPTSIVLPNPPFISIVSIVFDGEESSEGSDAVFEDYLVTTAGAIPVATVTPIDEWPTIETGLQAHVYFRAGYAVAGDSSEPRPLPAWARHAIYLMLDHWYNHRSAVAQANLTTLPLGVEYLLRPHRRRLGMA